jgi:hypothetical protein
MAYTEDNDAMPQPTGKHVSVNGGSSPAVTELEVQDQLGISRANAYREISAGRLSARKCGGPTLITFASAQASLNSLPSLAA